uniref:Piwi domain-containing protein n=1 Tax=Panagrolaimus superbus TaxID=310955 RepID=A0A914YFB9_9BILA
MDVCHPGINSEAEEPSSVGVVSNYLSDSNEFAGLFFYQSPGQEAINPSFLELYVKKMFHQAQKHRSIKNVIVLRDGISEGQYQMFVEKEMNAIIEATSEIKANYIAMIVTKDGITRHFMDISDRIQSMPSRSFISFGCRFGFNQMYMVAHNSTLGTARTAMITVLRDDMNLSKIELQTFLLGLTHMHQIVNAPISLPAPLQQTDSLAEHGQKGFRALKKEHERDIPKRDDGTIEYMQLSNLLNCSNGELPSTRYTA